MTAAAAPCFAGHRVISEIPLPALPCPGGIDAGAFLRIRLLPQPPTHNLTTPRWRHQWYEDDGSLSLRVAKLDNDVDAASARYLLQSPKQTDFLLEPDNAAIAVDPAPGLADNTLEHLLLDQALPRLLAGMGRLVVHASLVNTGAGALAFVGRSGWGKSTLAALFHRRGFPALCDDCALLDHHDAGVFATPSYPGFRLYADSIAAAQVNSPSVGPVSDYTDKQRIIGIETAQASLLPQPLRAIHVLSDPAIDSRAITFEPLSPAAACMALVEHAFRLDPSDAARTVRHLQQASAVSQAVPVYLLRYPREYALSDELTDRLMDYASRLPAATE